jgi:hypothetical protein
MHPKQLLCATSSSATGRGGHSGTSLHATEATDGVPAYKTLWFVGGFAIASCFATPLTSMLSYTFADPP